MNPRSQVEVVLTIAGFDPSSGAGVTADLKTIAAHGLYGVTCISALTVQTTQGVLGVECVRPQVISDTLCALWRDIPPLAVKIGMLGCAKVAACVADFLRENHPPNVVLDPVLRSSSGAELLDEGGVEVLKNRLFDSADVVTPNISEAGLLSGVEVADEKSMQAASYRLKQLGAKNIVITGGHLEVPMDLLAESQADGSLKFTSFQGKRIHTENTHGTGCAFSTALACNLARGVDLAQAVQLAKDYVADALRGSYNLGKGVGPVNHFARRR